MSPLTLSNQIFDKFEEIGVERVFLVPGGGNMFLVDALGTQRGIEAVATHHEQSAVIAAEYYGRVSGKLGVALVTTGPGSSNALTGIAGAWLDSVPLLVIAGQVKTKDYNTGSLLRQRGPQELDLVSMVENVTKFSKTCFSAETMLDDLADAIEAATTGRPGPAVLEIPLDIQSSLIELTVSSPSSKTILPAKMGLRDRVVSGDDQHIDAAGQIADLLAVASRPLFIIGNGVKAAKVVGEAKDMVNAAGIPVSLTWPTVDFMSFNHPLNAGRFGTVAKRYANMVIQKADVIVVLGSRLDAVQTAHNLEEFGKNARIILVDIDAAELAKAPNRFQKFNLNLTVLIPHLAARLSRYPTAGFSTTGGWLAEIGDLRERYGRENFAGDMPDQPISIYQAVDALSDAFTGGETIITGSSGLAVEVFYTHFQNKEDQKIALTTGLGAMGYGLPALLGASEASGAKTFLFESDGSLMMNLQELQSLRTRGRPVTIFVMNNNGYASIRATQANYFESRFVATGPASGLEIPPIENIARCFDYDFLRATTMEEIDNVVQRAIAQDGQMICEIVLREDEKLMPKCSVIRNLDNSLLSAPLEDMSPLLPIDELKSVMGDALHPVSLKLRYADE